MAGKMKIVHAPRTNENIVTVTLDLLAVPRGRRLIQRGGVHQTARKPSRAKGKRQMRRELAEGPAACRRVG